MRHLLKRVGTVGAMACFAASSPQVRGADAPKPAVVRVVRPSRGTATRYVTLPGSIKANQTVTLYAKVPGYLRSLTVDKGDKVSVGQTLGEIEAPELIADLAKHKAEADVAEIESKRLGEAQKKAPDLVVPQAVDDARGRLEIARANIDRIGTLLRYARLTSPFAGVVTARFVDPGAFIPAATSGNAANAAVLTVMDFNTVRAQVAVPEAEAALVRTGQPVKVSVEALPGKTFDGTVTRLAYALDEATKTMLVESDLPNPDLTLRPGMYATVKVGVEQHPDALLIPAEAIVMEKAKASVFVWVDGKAKKVVVKVGFEDGKAVEVSDGITAGSEVILAGKMPLADGQTVNRAETR